MLAKAIGSVGRAGINIVGYAEIDGVLHVLTTDPAATRLVLSDAGFRVVTEQRVLLLPIANEPGAAAGVFQRVADATINLRYSYLATGNRLLLGASDLDAVLKTLQP